MKQRETILASGVSSETPIHTQATARPWHLDNTAGPRIYARDHKGIFPIADIRGWGHLTGKGEGALGLSHDEGAAIQDANAALIVKAVNSHEALIDALERIVAIEDSYTGTDWDEIEEARAIARAALAGAK